MHYSFYRGANDVIVHPCWNALHKRGGKQSGDVDWSIIIKPHPLSTQEARLQLQSICNMVSYLTILVLEMVLNVTPQHHPQSLINLMGSLYGEAPSEEVSKHKSPWQQRRPCKRTTYMSECFSYSACNKSHYLFIFSLYITLLMETGLLCDFFGNFSTHGERYYFT